MQMRNAMRPRELRERRRAAATASRGQQRVRQREPSLQIRSCCAAAVKAERGEQLSVWTPASAASVMMLIHTYAVLLLRSATI
jgi:hypothetical protein